MVNFVNKNSIPSHWHVVQWNRCTKRCISVGTIVHSQRDDWRENSISVVVISLPSSIRPMCRPSLFLSHLAPIGIRIVIEIHLSFRLLQLWETSNIIANLIYIHIYIHAKVWQCSFKITTKRMYKPDDMQFCYKYHNRESCVEGKYTILYR